jgi:ATP-dependent protease HslVU (ClpYQ) peptidase subunit
MTCVVALTDTLGIWMGADSAVIDDDTFAVRTIREPKVCLRGSLLFGAAGELRAGQVIAQRFSPLKWNKESMLATEYAFASVEAMRELLIEHGASQKSKEQDKHDAVFLLGIAGHLFVVEDDYSVHEPAEPYAAIGAGADLALGAMAATETLGLEPHVRIKRALAAAMRFNASVREPFTVLHLPTASSS